MDAIRVKKLKPNAILPTYGSAEAAGADLYACLDMTLHQILPAAIHYARDLCNGIATKKELRISCQAEDAIARQLSTATDKLYACCEKLREDLAHIPAGKEDIVNYYHDTIVTDMQALREQADILESLTDKSYWPYPTYSDLLFY